MEKHPFRKVGERLKKLREGLSQEAFAVEVLGIQRTQYNRYEKGKIKPPREVLEKLATFGNVTIDWILFGIETDHLVSGIKKYLKDEVRTYLQSTSNFQKILRSCEEIAISDDEITVAKALNYIPKKCSTIVLEFILIVVEMYPESFKDQHYNKDELLKEITRILKKKELDVDSDLEAMMFATNVLRNLTSSDEDLDDLVEKIISEKEGKKK